MGTYVSQSDLETRFGREAIAKWADPDGDQNTTTVASNVTEAISAAEAEINDRFRGSEYKVPLEGSTTALAQIKRIAGAFAAFELYTARGLRDEVPNHMAQVREMAEEKIDRYLSGAAVLDCTRKTIPGESLRVATPARMSESLDRMGQTRTHPKGWV